MNVHSTVPNQSVHLRGVVSIGLKSMNNSLRLVPEEEEECGADLHRVHRCSREKCAGGRCEAQEEKNSETQRLRATVVLSLSRCSEGPRLTLAQEKSGHRWFSHLWPQTQEERISPRLIKSVQEETAADVTEVCCFWLMPNLKTQNDCTITSSLCSFNPPVTGQVTWPREALL